MQRETTDSGGTIYGRLVIVFIFGTALVMAIFAWAFRFYQGRQALDYWGPESAQVFAAADSLEFDLLPEENSDPKVSTDADDIPDLRKLLLLDESYELEKMRPREAVKWDYSLEFRAKDASLVVLFSAQEKMIARSDAAQAIPVIPSFAERLTKFLEGQWQDKPDAAEEIPPENAPDSDRDHSP